MNSNWTQETMRILYKDTDQMGVGHHANYVTWFEMGRTEWMRKFGLAYSDMESKGLLLPVMNVEVNYKKPAHYDDQISIFTRVTEYSKVKIVFEYEARIYESNERVEKGVVLEPYGELLASGSTTHMWLNQDWKPARLDKKAPEVFELLKKELQ